MFLLDILKHWLLQDYRRGSKLVNIKKMSKDSKVESLKERVQGSIQIRKDKRKSNLAQRRQASMGLHTSWLTSNAMQEGTSTIRDMAQLIKALPGSAKELSFILRNQEVGLGFCKSGGFHALQAFLGDLDVLTCLAYITYSDLCLGFLVKNGQKELGALGFQAAKLVSTNVVATQPSHNSVAAWILTNLAVSNHTKAMVSSIIQKVDVAPGLARIVGNSSDSRVKYWCLTSILKLCDELDMAVMNNKVEAAYINVTSVYDRLDDSIVPDLVRDLCSETLDVLAVCDILDLLNTLVSRPAFASRVSLEFCKRGLRELLHFAQSRDTETASLALCLLARQDPQIVGPCITHDTVELITGLLSESPSDKTYTKLCVAVLCMFFKHMPLGDRAADLLIQNADCSALCEFGRSMSATFVSTHTVKALVEKIVLSANHYMSESQLVEVLCVFKHLLEHQLISKHLFEELGGLTLVEHGMDDARPGISGACFLFFKEVFDDQDDQDDADLFDTNSTPGGSFEATSLGLALGGSTFGSTSSLGGSTFGSTSSLGGSTFGSTSSLGGSTFGGPPISAMFGATKAMLL
jgi:hypothetical protein